MEVRQLELVSEANHRFANHLEALAIMVQRHAGRICAGGELVTRDEATNALTDLRTAIVAMARLHRTLATEPAQRALALGDLLTEMLSDFKAIFQDRLRFHVSIPCEVTLEPARTSIFMQAFSEMVTNAMKHAHPTGLPVELTILGKSTPEGGIDLMIADDGVGLPEGSGDRREQSLGLRLIRGLIESLDGRVEIDSSELGLMFSISLPAPPQPRPLVHAVKGSNGHSPRTAVQGP